MSEDNNGQSFAKKIVFGFFFICVVVGVYCILTQDELLPNTTPIIPVNGSTYTVVETFVIGDTIDVEGSTKWVLSEAEIYYGYITISRVENVGYSNTCVIPLKYKMGGGATVIKTGNFEWTVIDRGYNWVKMSHN
jgi:hypothetical protein